MAFQQPTTAFIGNYGGYCDSYFVESHVEEEGLFTQAAEDRERHRQLSKLRQKALALEISRVTSEDYREDILDHMEVMERETMPDINSIEIQTEIQWFMRPYLLDFLLEAHNAFRLLPETFHLAVNLLDRYCSRRVVYKRHYQLVGCASLLIAAKYGDRKDRVPTIRELKLMCCSLYDDDMFIQMEWHVLQTVNWIVGHPTVTSFAQLAMSDSHPDNELEHMAAYFAEIALYHKEFIPVRPSVMARSSIALARVVLGRPQPRYIDWSSTYDSQVALSLSHVLSTASPALVRKYSHPLLLNMAGRLDEFLARQAMLAQAPAIVGAYAGPQQPQYNATQHLVPSTPQKVSYGAPPGVITPPITPDKDMRATHPFAPNAHMPGPSTPTPPPSVDHQQQQVVYQQHQYGMQPNFLG